MKYIFLDIDGVMLPEKPWVVPNLLEDGFYEFNQVSVNTLNSIINRDSVIVITSSHRDRFNLREWKSIFTKRGINSKIDKIQSETKIDGIINYIKSNLIKDYLIIDDDKRFNDLDTFYKSKLILTNSLVGLNDNYI